MDKNKSHFFIFGCWNRDNCYETENFDYRLAVSDLINSNQPIYHFGIIAGDNVYPHKSNKKKNYYWHTLQFGFDVILALLKNRTITKKIYGTIGNHDVDNDKILKYQITHSNIIMPNNMYIQPISNNLRLIFIDTNLYQKNNNYPTESQQNLKNNFYNVIDKKQAEDKLDKYLQDPFEGWTIVIGHEPICSFKKKGDKIKEDTLEGFQPMLDKLASIPQCVYMCADTHSFQAWNITTRNGDKLPMIVAGTGGAEPDETTAIKDNFKCNDNKFELIESRYPYGYCDVECTLTKMIIKYMPLDTCTSDKGNDSIITLEYQRNKKIKVLNIKKITKSCSARKIKPEFCNLENEVIKGGKRKMKK